VALERIFAAETPVRLGRVAEQSVGYGGAVGAATGGQASEDDGAGVAALAARHGVTLETLAARMDLSPAILRALAAGEANGGVTLTDLPPALLAQFAGALDAPLAEVAQALQAPSEDNGQAPTDDRRLAGSAFVDLITMAPSLSEAQRRHWQALLAADPT
jgi:transcriptional regulator with XRE-family HTH domain